MVGFSCDDDMAHRTDPETDEYCAEGIPDEDVKSPRREETAEHESEFEIVDEDDLTYESSRPPSGWDWDVD